MDKNPSKLQWDRHSILAELRRRGKKLDELAEENDRNPNTFRGVWTRPNKFNEQIIADYLGYPVEELFPDRYPKRANRIFNTIEGGEKASQKSTVAGNRVAA